MKRQVVITEADWNRIQTAFEADERETAAYALIGRSSSRSRERYLVREVIIAGEGDYIERLPYHLLIKPAFINRVAARCEKLGMGVLAMHSHPGHRRSVFFSPSDDFGEARELRVFNGLGLGAWPTLSMVIAPAGVRARVWEYSIEKADGVSTPVDELVILGDQMQVIPLSDDAQISDATSRLHARQALAIGKGGQDRLARTSVAVVGVGGTGSACAEMLARLGVGKLILIDGDLLEDTNVSRVYGSRKSDVGRPKVEVLRAWIGQISNSQVEAHQGAVHVDARPLKDADVIFVCTDTEISRAVANQVSYQYLIPLIDIGNRIMAVDGRVSAATTRLTFVGPGAPCLDCWGGINHDRARAESISKEEYELLRAEGYITGALEPEPSVISLNSFVASQAVNKFLDVVAHIGGVRHRKWTYSFLDGELRAARVEPRNVCVCRHFEGYGDAKQIPGGDKRK